MYTTCTVHVHVDIQHMYMYMYMCIHEYHAGSGGCTLLPRETGGWSLTGAKGLSLIARNLVDLASLLEHIATLDGLELQIPCHSTVDQQLHKLTCTYHAYMHVQVQHMIRTCIYTHVHVYIHTYMYIYTRTCIYTHIHVYIHTYMYIYTCTCIYTHVLHTQDTRH